MSNSVRIRELHARLDRLRAEIAGVESGVLPLIEERGQATPAQVAQVLRCSAQAANNTLAKLMRVGLLDREIQRLTKGGREFIYRLAVPEREETHGGE